jgi:hypothetical protein
MLKAHAKARSFERHFLYGDMISCASRNSTDGKIRDQKKFNQYDSYV